jgi:hypothetical protein
LGGCTQGRSLCHSSRVVLHVLRWLWWLHLPWVSKVCWQASLHPAKAEQLHVGYGHHCPVPVVVDA